MRIVSVSCIILLSASSFCVMPVVCSSNKIIESYLYRINVFSTRKRMNRLIDLLIQINSYQVFINCLIDWIGINFNRREMGKLKGDIPSKDVLLNASPISKWLSRKTFATNRRAQVSIINRPLNSISQPYDSKAKPRRNSSKKGNAEIGQRHVPAYERQNQKWKTKRRKKGRTRRGGGGEGGGGGKRQDDQPLLTVSLARPREFLKHCPVDSLWQWYFHSASRQTFDLSLRPHRSRQFQPAASTILFPKKDLLLWEDGTTSTSREVKFLFSCVFDFGNWIGNWSR